MGCGSSSIFYALKWSRNKWRNAFWECGFLIKILLLSFLAGKQQILIFAYLQPCMVVPGSGINFLHYSRRLGQGGSFWALQVENISELWSHELEPFSYFYLRVYNAGALNSSTLPGLIVLSLEGTGMHGGIHVYGRDHGRTFLVIGCVWRNLAHPTGARALLDTPRVLAAATGQRDTCRIQSLFKILLPWSWPRSPSQGSVRSEAMASGDHQSLLSGWMRSKLSFDFRSPGTPLMVTAHHLLGDRDVPETITEFLLVFSFSVICDLSGRAAGLLITISEPWNGKLNFFWTLEDV